MELDIVTLLGMELC